MRLWIGFTNRAKSAGLTFVGLRHPEVVAALFRQGVVVGFGPDRLFHKREKEFVFIEVTDDEALRLLRQRHEFLKVLPARPDRERNEWDEWKARNMRPKV